MIGEGGANLRVSTVGAGGRAGIAQNGFKSSGLGGVCEKLSGCLLSLSKLLMSQALMAHGLSTMPTKQRAS